MILRLIDNLPERGCSECNLRPAFLVEFGGKKYPKETSELCSGCFRKLHRMMGTFLRHGRDVPSARRLRRVYAYPKRPKVRPAYLDGDFTTQA